MNDPMTPASSAARTETLTKTPTFIPGFDEISEGGLPERRLIAIIGGTGSGKTVFALQTMVNRVRHLGRKGIFVCFEEAPENLRCNANAFAWDFPAIDDSCLVLLDGRLSPDAISSGDFDLGGLLAQIGALAEQIGASTLVLDGLDMVLSCLSDTTLERRELLRIAEWVHKHEMSCIITGKHSAGGARDATRQDYMHFITDLVVELDGRMYDRTYVQQLRIIKYRGSNFARDAFPAVIDDTGYIVLAKTKPRTNYPKFDERLSSGVAEIDRLLGGGYRRGSAVLVSGAPGTAKTTLAGTFAATACRAGEKVLYVSFDQSDSQLVHDLRSIGVDVEPHRSSRRLVVEPLRATSRGPALNYTTLCRLFDQHRPTCLIIDPISALMKSNYPFAAELCDDLLDEARARGMTPFCTSLAGLAIAEQELSVSKLSSVADTWLHLTYHSRSGERNRALTILKSRGMAHSNQVRELLMSSNGIRLVDVYRAEGEALMGTARAEKEHAEKLREIELEARRIHQSLALTQSLGALQMQAESLHQLIESKQQEIELFNREEFNRSEGVKAGAAERLRRHEAGDKDRGEDSES